MNHKADVSEEKHQRLVAKLKADCFYGILETHFEAGNITRIKRQETLLDKDIDRLMRQ